MSSQDHESVDHKRRGFFRAMAAETMSAAAEMRGVQQLRLDQIGGLPDDIIRTMVPVWNRHGAIRLQGNTLIHAASDGTPHATLLELGREQMRLLELFDGEASIDAIATAWASENGLEANLAYLQVKRLFLPLAELAILVPAGIPES
jgi:hypothetical protein